MSNDPDEVAALFAEDAAYSYGPFREPNRGRDAIVAEWVSGRGPRRICGSSTSRWQWRETGASPTGGRPGDRTGRPWRNWSASWSSTSTAGVGAPSTGSGTPSANHPPDKVFCRS
ncbi:MAG: hypothetical protein HYU54_06185 [Actinobacteria bacterium]|nr:hypothetical protein [Actinomycetota bacterium]